MRKRGRDKDEQWRSFRELLPEDSRDKPLTTVVDQLFRAVYGTDADIFLDGITWVVPIADRKGKDAKLVDVLGKLAREAHPHQQHDAGIGIVRCSATAHTQT